MKINIKAIIISTYVLVLYGCAANQSSRQGMACLYDNRLKRESTHGLTQKFDQWLSPDGKFLISYFKADQDHDEYKLLGCEVATGKTSILGFGDHGADVKWYKTSAGEIAVITNWVDNGTNEIYVAGTPGVAGNKWSLLYKTPNRISKFVVAHCYWEIMGFDGDLGVIKLMASWDFSDVTNSERNKMKTAGIYSIPLFYGSAPVKK